MLLRKYYTESSSWFKKNQLKSVVMRAKLSLWLNIICFCSAMTCTEAADITYKITGIEGKALENVQSRLQDASSSLSKAPSPGALDRFAQYRIPKEVQQALQPFGYFQSHSKITAIHYEPPYSIDLSIDTGKPILLKSVQIKVIGSGQHNPAFKALLKTTGLHPGQRMNSSRYELLKNRLFDMAANQGYFKAKMLSSELQVNVLTHQADINIVFNTGPRYRLGDIRFQGTTHLDPGFLMRYVPFHTGEYYTAGRIQALQSNLSGSGYFKSVIVTPEPGKSQHYMIPIVVSTTPVDSQQYTFGIGYGTDTGIRGLAAVNFRRIGKRGQHADAILRASQIAQNAQFNYYIPGRNPVTSQYVLTTTAENYNQRVRTTNNTQQTGSDTVDGNRNKAQLVRTTGRYDTLFWGWKQIVALNLLYEDFQLNSQPKQNTFITYPSINWYRQFWTDDSTKPTKGVSINVNASGAKRQFLSRKSYFRVLGTARGLYSWSDADWRLLGRLELGAINTNDINSMPYSLQFYTGGAQDLRGFRFNSIGPGHHLFVSSAEIQRRLKGNWYGEWFYDIGNVADRGFGQMNQGTGPGVVWVSPVGSFELTLANILQPKGGAKRRVQFSFGTDL